MSHLSLMIKIELVHVCYKHYVLFINFMSELSRDDVIKNWVLEFEFLEYFRVYVQVFALSNNW